MKAAILFAPIACMLLGSTLIAANAGLTVAPAARARLAARAPAAAPAPAATPASITGSSTLPLFAANNYGPNGSALYGYSASGMGIVGKTKAIGKTAGILGIDISLNGGNDDGVLGQTAQGGYGVEGIAGSGAIGAVHASAVGFATGLRVDTVNGYGANIVSGTGTAVNAASATGSALTASTSASNNLVNPAEIDSLGDYDGIDSSGRFWNGGVLTLTARHNTTNGIFASLIHAVDAYNGVHLMDLAQNGSLYLHGGVISGASQEHVVHTASGAQLLTYSSRSATPTMEDTGEAQMLRGQAYVRIDPALAATLDPREMYSVLVTPEGETRGVYVTDKSRLGFRVREIGGGTSNLDFAYRIVGRVSGESVRPRLADLRADRTYALFNAAGDRDAVLTSIRNAREREASRIGTHLRNAKVTSVPAK